MFCGSMVAIVTPMTSDGALDLPAWDRLLDFHAGEGTTESWSPAPPESRPRSAPRK